MERIIIERLDRDWFNVVQGDKYSDRLRFEEMLGLIAALTMPKETPCIHWMKTETQSNASTGQDEKVKVTHQVAGQDVTRVGRSASKRPEIQTVIF